ncbi:MAG: hypothetical protein JNK15_04685 [Planctomycetes bacterium]|nr:hypothetical protein [Planctomycetota bacterium]
MTFRFAISLLSVLAVATFAWPAPAPLHAVTDTTALPDTDGDFLPDCVEWAILTSATNPDTDGDLIGDFIEVVQRGAPRIPGASLPTDHEMRIIVTGADTGGESSPTWLHLFLRYAEPNAMVTLFQAWVELPNYPGVRFPFDCLAQGAMVVNERQAGVDGTWLQVSVPLVQPGILRAILPCSFNAEATIGGRYLRSTASLFELGPEIATLVPFGTGKCAAQSITPNPSTSTLSNRVCLLDLEEVGSGPGGTVYQIAEAFCDDCNEVECAVTCPQSEGWLITIPGGLGAIGSNN